MNLKKVWLPLMVSLALLLAGCTGIPARPANTPAGNTPAPAEIPEPEQKGTELPFDFSNQWTEESGWRSFACEADLDGDGENEFSVAIEQRPSGWNIAVRRGEKESSSAFGDEYGIVENAILADTDPSDGAVEIFASWTYETDDYTTYGWRFDGETLAAIRNPDSSENPDDRLYGFVKDVRADGTLIVEQWMDLLGTYAGTRECRITADAEYEESDLWRRVGSREDCGDNGGWGILTVSRELPAKDEAGQEMIIHPGETLFLSEARTVEGGYEATLLREDGTKAILEVELRIGEYGFEGYSIAGLREEEFFELLPYAG